MALKSAAQKHPAHASSALLLTVGLVKGVSCLRDKKKDFFPLAWPATTSTSEVQLRQLFNYTKFLQPQVALIRFCCNIPRALWLGENFSKVRSQCP